jgi:hypothetical protein
VSNQDEAEVGTRSTSARAGEDAIEGDRLRSWVAAHNWAVTTEHDCWGYPPPREDQVRWALYDADEDDPPIGIFDFKEDAMLIAAALNQFGARL